MSHIFGPPRVKQNPANVDARFGRGAFNIDLLCVHHDLTTLQRQKTKEQPVDIFPPLGGIR